LFISAIPSFAQIGFQPKLNIYSEQLSDFRDPDYSFTSALFSQKDFILTNRLRRINKVTSSNFEAGSLQITTELYAGGREKFLLLPISVDAYNYYLYRSEVYYRYSLVDASIRALRRKNEDRKSDGIGLKVALPKRLDQIFGEGGAGLKVSGYRKISLAGRSTWTDAVETSAYKQSRFPSLKMDQISRFEITGNIGSKITVRVQQDSQIDIPLANRIQIRYKGDEDDILKIIEAGNTTLSLPNTQFVGYSSNIRGLFGLKAEAQIGNLRLIGIASQEKGSTERSSFSPTGEESAEYIRDYEYAERRIFDLGRKGIEDGVNELELGDSVITLFMFETVSRSSTDISGNLTNFYVNPNAPDSFIVENQLNSGIHRVEQIPNNEYEYYTIPTTNEHYIVFKSGRSRNNTLGYWMEVRKSNGTLVTFGDISGEVYNLKLLARASDQSNPSQETWDLMWRNIYNIPRASVLEDLNLKVYKGLPGSESSSSSTEVQNFGGVISTYVEILGLDQYTNDALGDKKIPDKIIDNRQEIFRADWGLIIFPTRRPFDSDTTFTDDVGRVTPILSEKVSTIYDYNSYSEKLENSKYFVQMSTKSRSSIIKLNRANIIEGSEKITVNGRQLTEGIDYSIQYDFGQITLLSDEAIDPNADLQIDYEYAPFFAVQKKTLLGFRGEYEWSDNFKVGSTFLYKSDKAQDRKPKVGQETAKTIVFDADMQLNLSTNFMTRFANSLPLIETEALSNVAISSEIAKSFPNPNVNNDAYVDDFEAATEYLSIGSSRTIWKKATKPLQLDDFGSDYSRGKILWHNPTFVIPTDDVYERETSATGGTLRTFRMIYRPQNYRIDTLLYDTSNQILISYDSVTTNSWAGIMRGFNRRVDSKRAQLFEIRAKAQRGKLHFDFGIINEDVNNDFIANSEDLPPRGNQNKAVEEFEDVGVDGIPDDEEFGYNPSTNPDPAGDNWFFNGEGKCPIPGTCDTVDWTNESHPLYYEFLNGTEGNILDGGSASIPDQETLDQSFTTSNSYFSYVIDFESDSFFVEGSERDVDGDGIDNPWRTYRIPIKDSLAVDQYVASIGAPNPSWTDITHVRIWFESDESSTLEDTVEVADWGFVQSNWQDTIIFSPESDGLTNFLVASVSEQDQTFVPPPEVDAYIDPTTNLQEPQRGLLLEYNSLNHLDSCLAVKDLITVDRYGGYRRMNIFYKGNFENIEDTTRVKFFFRLGRDESNYYEYGTKVDTVWDQVDIDFNEITAVKDSAIRNLGAGQSLSSINISSGNYRVVGNPNLNEIRYFVAGVVNLDSTTSIDGSIWLDELRVSDVRKDVGTAGRISMDGNIADLLKYNFNYKTQDAFFRGLSTATRGGSSTNLGSGRDDKTFNYGFTLNVDKFLPRSWGAKIPVSYNYSKRTLTPLLKTNSDIVLPDEVRGEEEEINTAKTLTVSASFNRKSKNLLFSVLLNRMKTRFSFRRSEGKSVRFPYTFGENYDLTTNYDLTLKKRPSLPIFFWTKSIPLLKSLGNNKLSFYPETWTTSMTYSRNITASDDVDLNRRSSFKRNFNGNMKMKYRLFPSLVTNFNIETRRDLSDPDRVSLSLNNFRLGLETHFAQQFTTTYTPKFVKFLTNNLNYTASYTDDLETSSQSLRSSLARNYSINGQLDHFAMFGGKTQSAKRNQSRSRGSRDSAKKGGKGEDDLKKKKRPFYDYPLSVFRFLTGWIKPIKYSYSKRFNFSLPGLKGRPRWQYRYGFEESTDIELTLDPRPQSSSKGKVYDFQSGFSFLGGINTNVKFSKSISTDLIKQSNLYEIKSTNWPNLTISIGQFKKFPFFKKQINKFIRVFSPRTGFNRQSNETYNIEGGFITNKTTITNYRPVFSFTFRPLKALNLNSTYNFSKNEEEKYNLTTGDIQSISIAKQSTFDFTIRYSFSSPTGIKLPILGRLKVRSTVDISTNVKFNSNKTETSSNGEPFRPSIDKDDISISPIIAYTFSEQIKGGLTMRWQDSNDNTRNRKTHSREVQIWTEIRF
jgi:hypothetical protein